LQNCQILGDLQGKVLEIVDFALLFTKLVFIHTNQTALRLFEMDDTTVELGTIGSGKKDVVDQDIHPVIRWFHFHELEV
jgi:hypothetical protein